MERFDKLLLLDTNENWRQTVELGQTTVKTLQKPKQNQKTQVLVITDTTKKPMKQNE